MLSFSPWLALLVAPVAGQDAAPSKLVDRFSTCLAIADDAERLRCMDAAAQALVSAAGRRDVVLVDREEMKKTRRSLFGFTLPRINLFGRDGPDNDPEEVKRIDTTIKQFGSTGYDRYVITTEDGARWTTTEAWSGQVLPKVGKKVTIKRGAMGSYIMEVEGGRAIRAMRTG